MCNHGILLGTLDRIRNSRGKKAISVRAIEVLLYVSFVERWEKKVNAYFTYQINISRYLLQITFVSVWPLPRVIPYLFFLLFMAYVLILGYVP